MRGREAPAAPGAHDREHRRDRAGAAAHRQRAGLGDPAAAGDRRHRRAGDLDPAHARSSCPSSTAVSASNLPSARGATRAGRSTHETARLLPDPDHSRMRSRRASSGHLLEHPEWVQRIFHYPTVEGHGRMSNAARDRRAGARRVAGACMCRSCSTAKTRRRWWPTCARPFPAPRSPTG